MRQSRRRKALGTVWSMTIAASLLWGCGFHAYEYVQMTETVQTAAEADSVSGTAGSRPENASGETEVRAGTGQGQANGDVPVIEIPAAETESGAVTLLFGGDVYLSDHVLQAYRAAGGISGVLDEGYRSAVRGADLFFVNEEFPFSTRGTAAADKQYTFRLDPSNIRLFQEMGIGGVTLANNHALDFGTDALLDSCSTLDGAGIPHTGAGESLDAAKRAACYEIGGKKIAVIGASRVFPAADWAAGPSHAGMLTAYDPAALISEIRSLKETQDVVIAYVHWGVERAEQPNEVQKSLGRQLIDAGADLVIGAHPHVLQGVEYYGGKPIVYSLGNFVFGSSIPRTALLEVTLEESSGSGGASGAEHADGDGTKALRLRLIPGTSAAGFTRTLTEESGRRAFFDYMQNLSFGVQIGDDGVISQAQP